MIICDPPVKQFIRGIKNLANIFIKIMEEVQGFIVAILTSERKIFVILPLFRNTVPICIRRKELLKITMLLIKHI